MAAQMDANDRVPFLDRHVEDHAVAQDAGDIHEDIELAEFLDRLIDEALATFGRRDVLVIGGGRAAGRLDFLGDIVSGRLRFLLSGDG